MKNTLKSALLSVLCGATTLSALPPEALAMSVAPPSVVGLTTPVTQIRYYGRHWRRHHWGYWRPHYRHWGYHRHHYRHWGYYRPHYRRAYYYRRYDPAGAMFAGAALGLMGAGIAAATAPRWGYAWGGYGWGPGWGWGGWW